MIMLLSFSCIRNVYAVDTTPTEEWKAQEEERKSLTVDTNNIQGWPQGPSNGAESAILMDADTGTILYSKNIEEQLYPASITKMMTALLTVENCSMEDVVTFSSDAINNTELNSSRIGIMIGEELTVEQALHGLLLGSANEVAYGLAEHVGGSLENFVQMMNDKAAELGCEHTHFANASGLPDENHYVCAHDMARIARAFFNNETLCMISGTYSYTIPPTNKTDESRPLENHHKMVTGKKYEYDGIIGGKTGFTSVARQTLVTCAQRNGMKLVCVVLKDESPNQFLDTAALLDYGFANFEKKNIADYETRYKLDSATFFHTKLDIMGSSKSLLTINKEGKIILPKVMQLEDCDVNIEYLDNDAKAIARLNYSIGGYQVGSTTIDYAEGVEKTFEFANIITDESGREPTAVEPNKSTIFVSVKKIVIYVAIIVGVIFVIMFICSLIIRYIKSAKRSSMKKKTRYKSRSENTRKYNYKKRSENRKRTGQSAVNEEGNLYTKPIYQELAKFTAESAKSDQRRFKPDEEESPNYSDFNDDYYEDDGSSDMSDYIYEFEQETDEDFESNHYVMDENSSRNQRVFDERVDIANTSELSGAEERAQSTEPVRGYRDAQAEERAQSTASMPDYGNTMDMVPPPDYGATMDMGYPIGYGQTADMYNTTDMNSAMYNTSQMYNTTDMNNAMYNTAQMYNTTDMNNGMYNTAQMYNTTDMNSAMYNTAQMYTPMNMGNTTEMGYTSDLSNLVLQRDLTVPFDYRLDQDFDVDKKLW